MKLKIPILLIILLIISSLTIFFPTNIVKPFYYLKDFIFSSVHAISSDNSFANDLEESIIENLKEDILSLKKMNNITLSVSEFNCINATVISRNREYWFNTLTINKGSNDGIDVDMAVVDSDGLIGRISMVTGNTAMIKLITTNDTKSKISAVIHLKDKDIYGIVSGYDTVNNLLSLIITDNVDITYNSKVETTGMGGVFPRGILIGKVYDIVKKEDGITNVVRVKPSSNIEGERYVSVLQRKKDSIN